MVGSFVILAMSLLGGALAAPAQHFNTRYDNVELSKILYNEELYVQLMQCILGRGRCTPDQAALRDAVPRALLDNCDGCSDKQKIGTQSLLRHLILEKQDDMLQLEGEHDPDGSYRKQFEKEDSQTNFINRKRSAALEGEVEFLEHPKRDIK